MHRSIEFKTDSKILYEIFSFYRQTIIDVDTPVSFRDESIILKTNTFIDEKTKEIEAKGKDYINQVIKEFEEYPFQNTKAYTRNNISGLDFLNCMLNCAHIKETIYENLSPKRKEDNERMENYGKLERKLHPPLEAYKYKPFNKMSIKHSDKSYGLLFE